MCIQVDHIYWMDVGWRSNEWTLNGKVGGRLLEEWHCLDRCWLIVVWLLNHGKRWLVSGVIVDVTWI